MPSRASGPLRGQLWLLEEPASTPRYLALQGREARQGYRPGYGPPHPGVHRHPPTRTLPHHHHPYTHPYHYPSSRCHVRPAARAVCQDWSPGSLAHSPRLRSLITGFLARVSIRGRHGVRARNRFCQSRESIKTRQGKPSRQAC